MSTLYDLFKVKENATPEELKEAYDKILAKADSLPQTDKIVEQTQRIKIAYGILSDLEKRKRYDLDLATKRANELIETVPVKEEIPDTEETKQQMLEDSSQQEKNPQMNEDKIKQEIEKQIQNASDSEAIQNKELEKQRKKLERKYKRQAKKEQQLKREREIQEYGAYLEKQGYKVKYPWTWLRIKRLLISIIAVMITLFILWHIPIVRKTLTDLYHENFVVKFLVDMIRSIFSSLIDAIKGIFQ